MAATRRSERRSALETEARRAGIDFYLTLVDISRHLEQAFADGTAVPALTAGREWAVSALRAEIAMFSVDQAAGAAFSPLVGNLRRSMEIIEGHNNPQGSLVQSAIKNNQELTDHLADWLMMGRHRTPAAQAGQRLPE